MRDGKPYRSDNFEDLDVDGRGILKWIVSK
jgi:hypothetical protein